MAPYTSSGSRNIDCTFDGPDLPWAQTTGDPNAPGKRHRRPAPHHGHGV